MPNTVTLKIEGLATIQKALEGLTKEVQDHILGEALAAGAEILRGGIAGKIHTRTGATARDLQVALRLDATALAGLATIGGTIGKQGRAYILNFLERGTKPHREPKSAARSGSPRRAISRAQLTTRLARLSAAQAAKTTRLVFGGKIYSRVNHPGTNAQAPMRETIATHGERAVSAFGRRAWDLIRQYCAEQAA